jgi:hypothetical protein
MHIKPGKANPLPRIHCRVPSTTNISANVKDQSDLAIDRFHSDSKSAQNETARGKQGEPLPFIITVRERLVLARSILRPLERDPSPERNGRRTRLLLDERAAKYLLNHHT